MRTFNLEPSTRILALCSVILGILLVTLFPSGAGLASGFEKGWAPFSGADFVGNLRHVTFMDVAQNLLLFLPFGFLAVTFIPSGPLGIRPPAWCFLAGIGLSAGVEALQTWIPGRYPSLSDVLLNGLGALCGALWAAQSSSRFPATVKLLRWKDSPTRATVPAEGPLDRETPRTDKSIL